MPDIYKQVSVTDGHGTLYIRDGLGSFEPDTKVMSITTEEPQGEGLELGLTYQIRAEYPPYGGTGSFLGAEEGGLINNFKIG